MKGLSGNRTLNIFTNLYRSANSFEQAAKELTSTAKEMMDFSGEINNKSILDNAIQSLNNIDMIGILVFLKEWLFNHTKVEDQKYSTPMNKNGIK